MAQGLLYKLIFFGLTFAAVLIEVGGDVLFKKWALGGRTALLIVGILVYFCGVPFWALSLKYEYLSKAISVFTVLNLIIVVSVGILFFKEDLSLINKVGIALGVVSIILIEL